MNNYIRWCEYLERDTNIPGLPAELLLLPARLENAAARLLGDVTGNAEARFLLFPLSTTPDAEQHGPAALLSTRFNHFVLAPNGLTVSQRTDRRQ